MPSDAKGPGRIRRLVLHHTGGANSASSEDKQAYHILVNRVGHVSRGDHAITDNLDCTDDDYAAHTMRLNTGSIGVAICAMAGAHEEPFAPGPYPIKPAQWNAALLACADLCERYRLAPAPRSLLMHCEVEAVYGVKQNKWDIKFRTWEPPAAYTAMTPGDELRARVAILLSQADE